MKYILIEVHTETFLCKRKFPNVSLRKVTIFTKHDIGKFNKTVMFLGGGANKLRINQTTNKSLPSHFVSPEKH